MKPDNVTTTVTGVVSDSKRKPLMKTPVPYPVWSFCNRNHEKSCGIKYKLYQKDKIIGVLKQTSRDLTRFFILGDIFLLVWVTTSRSLLAQSPTLSSGTPKIVTVVVLLLIRPRTRDELRRVITRCSFRHTELPFFQTFYSLVPTSFSLKIR